MISIAARLQNLKKANYRETEILDFPDGTQIIISTLTGKEDRALSDYVQQYLDKAIGYYAKLETIAHSIRWIKPAGETPIDLHDVEFIETGDVLDNGVAVKKAKNVFLRDIVESWPDTLLDAVFARYARLVEDMEEDVSRGIKIEMNDDVLSTKIRNRAEELGNLVRQARMRGLKPIETYDFTIVQKTPEEQDALSAALKAAQDKIVPPPVPPVRRTPQEESIDAQIDKEREENPTTYRVTPVNRSVAPVGETPTRVRS